ncbi:MAG: response regulator [Candidatus Hydrogenedentota bacterium]
MKKKTATRVLVVDDHSVVREGLAAILGSDPAFEVCGLAGTAAEALRLAEEVQPDIITLDLRLRDDNGGLSLLKSFRQQHKAVKVLVNSVCDEQIYAERCLRAGAAGFINKGASKEELLDALRQVEQGKVYLSGDATDQMLRKQFMGQTSIEPAVNQLSNREIEVFEKLAEGRSMQEIADQLCLSVKTVESHRENIKDKLGFESSRELAHYAIQWAMDLE